MLARLCFAAAFLGFCLAAPTGIVLAEDDAETTVAPQTPDESHPPHPGWDDERRPPQPPHGMQPPHDMQPPPRMRDRMPHRHVKDGYRKDKPHRDAHGMPKHPRGDRGMGDQEGHPKFRPGMDGRLKGNPGIEGHPKFKPGMDGRPRGKPGMRNMAGMGDDELKMTDPEMYEILKQDRKLQYKSIKLSEKFHCATENEQEEIRKQLEEIVIQHFEVRQQRRRLQLERVEKELQRLREAIEQREEARDEIIKRRIMHLTGQKDPLAF